MRISDCSSDVCSSDLSRLRRLSLRPIWSGFRLPLGFLSITLPSPDDCSGTFFGGAPSMATRSLQTPINACVKAVLARAGAAAEARLDAERDRIDRKSVV